MGCILIVHFELWRQLHKHILKNPDSPGILGLLLGLLAVVVRTGRLDIVPDTAESLQDASEPVHGYMKGLVGSTLLADHNPEAVAFHRSAGHIWRDPHNQWSQGEKDTCHEDPCRQPSAVVPPESGVVEQRVHQDVENLCQGHCRR